VTNCGVKIKSVGDRGREIEHPCAFSSHAVFLMVVLEGMQEGETHTITVVIYLVCFH